MWDVLPVKGIQYPSVILVLKSLQPDQIHVWAENQNKPIMDQIIKLLSWKIEHIKLTSAATDTVQLEGEDLFSYFF